MTPLEIAREKVIATALILAGRRIAQDVREPRADDAAQAEMDNDMLDAMIGEYAQVRAAELEGSDRG